MKNFAVALCFCLIAFGGYAMIEPVSLELLAQGADLVVIADVEGVKSAGILPAGPEVMANLVKVAESLKGGVAVGEKLKIKTYRRIEDNADLVEGSKVLLFLKKVEEHYEVFYGIQGCWPIETDGRFSGMGDGKTLDAVKEAIKAKPAAPGKYEPVSL